MTNPLMFFRLLLAAFLLCVGAQHALAQQVLLLTTNSDPAGPNPEDADAIAAYQNLENEFTNALPSSGQLTRRSVLGNANAISAATFTAASGSAYDIVIVASTYRAVDPSNWAVLQTAVANRWANSIVFFVDGCCENRNAQNAQRMVDTLNAGTQSTFSLGTTVNAYGAFPLNTNSPYAGSFTALNPLQGGYITYINNVPANNALYVAGALPPAGTTPTNNVYGLLIPTVQSNAGRGACVFAVVDISIFYGPPWTTNQGKVAPAFLNAATSESGACGLPKVSKSFDKTDLYLGGSDNTTLLTITLSNSTSQDISNVTLSDKLPAPLVVAPGAVSNSCTAGTFSAVPGSDIISDSGMTIPGGGCTITVPVQWPNTDAGRQACISTPSVTNTITPGTDFVSPTGQVNTPATASLACHAAQLAISKQVVWPANVTPVDLTGSSFPVSVVCTGSDGVVAPAINTSITLDTATTGSVSTTPVIASGSCVVTEGTRPTPPANHLWVEDPAPIVSVTMAAPPAANSAQLVNTLARANTDITISKAVAGGPAAGISGSFSFSVNCGADGSFTAAVSLSGSNAGAIAITNVPQGASCTVSEAPTMPEAPAGYTWSTSLPAPVTLVTAANGNTASFVNTLVRTAPAVPAAVPALDTIKLLLMVAAMALLGMLVLRRAQRR
ncbi:DUF5979 domain-containing protein [Comamonas sp. B-9]|uniref:DUF5979 domain-containing protein n=1 Tax=Comamonas sp. B-9 TaxID=1055192 RepID=UPI0003957984|nr:DUF5979 domain-containing protein [Comamonas sp. B-9]